YLRAMRRICSPIPSGWSATRTLAINGGSGKQTVMAHSTKPPAGSAPRCDDFVMWSQRKEFSCDPTATTNAGGSADSPVLAHYHTDLPARHRRVRPTLRQTTGSTWSRAHPALSTVSDQREESFAPHLHSGGVRTAVLLHPHAQPENRHRTHSVSPAG